MEWVKEPYVLRLMNRGKNAVGSFRRRGRKRVKQTSRMEQQALCRNSAPEGGRMKMELACRSLTAAEGHFEVY